MKYLSIILSLLLIISCKNSNSEFTSRNECLPGHILITHLGEENHPISPIFILTKEDTTYLKYKEYDEFSVDFKSVAGIGIGYMKRNIETISDSTFRGLKKYILENNTNKDYSDDKESQGAFKLFLYDKCDSITYAVNSGDQGIKYLQGFISILEIESYSKSIKNLEYYKQLDSLSLLNTLK